jgi:hypothetical protein
MRHFFSLTATDSVAVRLNRITTLIYEIQNINKLDKIQIFLIRWNDIYHLRNKTIVTNTYYFIFIQYLNILEMFPTTYCAQFKRVK